MPSYKLTYFNVKARAETPRMLFKLAGVDFVDERIEREKWAEMKPNTPMGQLPVLDVDGVQLCQSSAISRYLARQFGYAGKSELDQARVDMVVDSVEDVLQSGSKFFREQDEDKKKAFLAEFKETTFPGHMGRLQKILELNNGGDGFFVGDEMTFADLNFVNIIALMLKVSQLSLDGFPKLAALVKRVEAVPQIAAWIKERPVTDM